VDSILRAIFFFKWECGGGQVRKGEGFESAIRRQIFEEFGLDVQPYSILQAYEIHGGVQRIIPGIRWVCIAHEGRVRLNMREFTRYRWLKFPLPKSIDWIGGVKEALEAIAFDTLPDPAPTEAPRKPARRQQLGFGASSEVKTG
jgi:ADP-ribose pyrophosphatase YjhB (NUDIX family)